MRDEFIEFAKAWARVSEIQQVEEVLADGILGNNNPAAIRYAIRDLRQGGAMGLEIAAELQDALDASCEHCGGRKGNCECGGEG